jgi:hypothetical protein
MKQLLIIDRATGAEEKVPQGDPRFMAEVTATANASGMLEQTVLTVLRNGQQILTAGFLRQLVDE